MMCFLLVGTTCCSSVLGLFISEAMSHDRRIGRGSEHDSDVMA